MSAGLLTLLLLAACACSPCSAGVVSGLLLPGRLEIVAMVAVWPLGADSTPFIPEMLIQLGKYSTAESDPFELDRPSVSGV